MNQVNEYKYQSNEPFLAEINYYEDEGWMLSTEYHSVEEIKDYFDNGFSSLKDAQELYLDYLDMWEDSQGY